MIFIYIKTTSVSQLLPFNWWSSKMESTTPRPITRLPVEHNPILERLVEHRAMLMVETKANEKLKKTQ